MTIDPTSFEDTLALAISESLAPIDNLQESPYMLGNVTTPAAEVLSGMIDFDKAFDRGTDRYVFTVRITVGTSLDIGAQKWLRRLRAPSGDDSIKQALEVDRHFGGLAQDSQVLRLTQIRIFQRPGGASVIGFDAELEVYADGTQG